MKSIDDWIEQRLAEKGYIRAQEDREDFIKSTGAGATKFNKWMKNGGLVFDKETGKWTRRRGWVSSNDLDFMRSPGIRNHIDLLDYRKLWSMFNEDNATMSSVSRETGLNYARTQNIFRKLEEYFLEGVLDDWLRVTAGLLSIQNERGADHRKDEVMMQMRIVFVDYVRDPINTEEVPSDDDITGIYEELLELEEIGRDKIGGPDDSRSPMTELEFILNEAGNWNFPRGQGAWGDFERRCGGLTDCGWKMGMVKSSSGKDNAINRMYTTGVIRAYPKVLIHALFIDDFLDDMSRVYITEFGEKMRCSPIMLLIEKGADKIWRTRRALIQHSHPLLPISVPELQVLLPEAEIVLAGTEPIVPREEGSTDGGTGNGDLETGTGPGAGSVIMPRGVVVDAVGNELGVDLEPENKRAPSMVTDPDGENAVIALVSREHEKDLYWYGLRDTQLEWLMGAKGDSWVALGCSGVEAVVLLPLDFLTDYLAYCNRTEEPTTDRPYFHIQIQKLGDDFVLNLPNEDSIPLDDYLIDDAGHEDHGGRRGGAKKTPVDVTLSCVEKVSEKLGIEFRKGRTRAKFSSQDGKYSMVMLVSKEHPKQKYWFGLFDHQLNWFESRDSTHKWYGLACGGPELIFIFPVEEFQIWKNRISSRVIPSRGNEYWHVNVQYRDGSWKILTMKGHDDVDLSPFRISS